MQLSSRILTALAVLILAVAVVAVRAGSPGTVEAATGDISVLNVGTCYTTNTESFDVGDCNDGDENDNNDDAEDNSGYEVADRDTISSVDTVYATYAIDPKTSGDQPRAIAKNSDVIKIRIEDKGRDDRTGVLYATNVGTAAPLIDGTDATEASATIIRTIKLPEAVKAELLVPNGEPNIDASVVQLTGEALFTQQEGGTLGRIVDSGDATFNLLGAGSTDHEMAPPGDGRVFWFGTVTDANTTGDLINLTDTYIELDEDVSSGTTGSVSPWMRVTASIAADEDITVHYIYYETSEREVLIGDMTQDGYAASDDADDAPRFHDAEKTEKQQPLLVRASADGVPFRQNLRLRETSRFSGIYEGFLQLTDADGDGSVDDDLNTDAGEKEPKDNWGLKTRDATGENMAGATILAVESGPVEITYKNSNDDDRKVEVSVDKDAPAIQIDSPVNDTASTRTSPELIGSFSDGGGSGLREDSFRIYAHNQPDEGEDLTPVWDFGVLSPLTANGYSRPDRGFLCVDTDAEDTDPCDEGTPTLTLRAEYSGYQMGPGTYGIIHSSDVYLNLDDGPDADDAEDYKATDGEPYEDGAASGEFDTILRIDFPPERDDKRYNNAIDIQAVVMDVAGNIGFSDSDPSAPTYIHDVGTASKDRADDDKHNVLGWFSRHVYHLDDVDPEYSEDESATGFYVNSDGDEDINNSGVMIVFDNDIDAATVGIGTFEVDLDDGTDATVIDARVDGKKVYLLLEEELAPNSTPQVDLAVGQSVSDLAGNESTDRRLDGIELSDGILPTFTITLSGGSGLNEDEDGEGPSELTNESGIKISIAANEAIQGSPKFAVVCSSLYWDADSDDTSVSEFADQRTGGISDIDEADPKNIAPHTSLLPELNDDGDDQRTMCKDEGYFDVAITSALARPGNNWEYQWSNLSDEQAVSDGDLSVIVWGRDRSNYKTGKVTVYNYSASTAGFTYDTDLMPAWDVDGQETVDRELVPNEGEDVFEVRPFVLLDFGDEDTNVDVTTFEVDGTDYTADLQAIEDNEFVWWPEPLAIGTYEVYVEANDAADNQDHHTYSFEVKERAPFVLNLLAGWNSISFPANPVDRALHAVFTNTAIDQVIGWNVTEPVSPWRMATRVDGVWTTSEDVATLNDVEARYGYWVHSEGFITQAVALAGKGDRATDGQPNPADIPTDEGWNFVGVVDVDGDQTQDDAGETLRNSNNDPITAAEYLGGYIRAYTWDHINNTWDVLKNDEGIVIGTGVWVYYTAGHDIAP